MGALKCGLTLLLVFGCFGVHFEVLGSVLLVFLGLSVLTVSDGIDCSRFNASLLRLCPRAPASTSRDESRAAKTQQSDTVCSKRLRGFAG